MDLPERTDAHVTGDEGSRIVRDSIPSRWVYRDLEGKSDYGIDAEIEIFDGKTPTGLLFRVQIRAHGSLRWNLDGTHVQSVRESTRNYWRIQTTPVAVVVCDVEARAAYWAFADEGETDSGMRVARTNRLSNTNEALRAGVEKRLNLLGLQSLILTAPLLEGYWNDLEASTGGDSFLPIDDDVLAWLKAVYAQVPLLRYALALSPASFAPFDVWVARSHLAFNDYYEIHWGVFDEMVEYLRPAVMETLDAAAEKLSLQDPTTGNANVTVINWALRRLGRNLSWGRSLPFAPDRQFWEQFDQMLASRGVRHFSATDAYDQRRKIPK
jgi:hypothetical protein